MGVQRDDSHADAIKSVIHSEHVDTWVGAMDRIRSQVDNDGMGVVVVRVLDREKGRWSGAGCSPVDDEVERSVAPQ